MGDNEDITTFLNLMLSNFLLPQILQPTRITTRSKTLINNIYLSNSFGETMSGNLTTQISDHLPQFLIIKGNPEYQKRGIKLTKRDYQKFR